jgi:hypothetical protein
VEVELILKRRKEKKGFEVEGCEWYGDVGLVGENPFPEDTLIVVLRVDDCGGILKGWYKRRLVCRDRIFIRESGAMAIILLWLVLL